MLKYKTNSFEETQKVAEDLAKKILKNKPSRQAFVIALEGELGAGKTSFVQGFSKGFGIKEKITSPTFNIYKNYKLQAKNYKLFYHFDCYRIERPEEILALGFKEIISNPQNIVAIEWPEKIKKVLPKNTYWLFFNFIDDTVREIKGII